MLGYYVKITNAPVTVLVEIAKEYDLTKLYKDAQASGCPETCSCKNEVSLKQLVSKYEEIPSDDLTIFVEKNCLVQYASMDIQLGNLNTHSDMKTAVGVLALAVTENLPCKLYKMKQILRTLMMNFVYEMAKTRSFEVEKYVV